MRYCGGAEKAFPGSCIFYCGAVDAISIGNFLNQWNQGLQKLYPCRNAVFYIALSLIGCVLVNIAVPRILSIVISDRRNIINILL